MACKNETFDTGSKDEPSTQLHDVIDNGAFQDPFTNINIKDEDGGESMQESIGRGNEQDLLEKDDQLKNSISSNCDDSESMVVGNESLVTDSNKELSNRSGDEVDSETQHEPSSTNPDPEERIPRTPTEEVGKEEPNMSDDTSQSFPCENDKKIGADLNNEASNQSFDTENEVKTEQELNNRDTDTKGVNSEYSMQVYKHDVSDVNENNSFTENLQNGTGSMSREIERARISVGQFIKKYKERGGEAEFKVVIYRDHCDDNLIETFPQKEKFTSQHKTIEQFLENVEATGGGDNPEAVLDGLATAATKCEWENKLGRRNLIIHIYDAPPHGDFPNYKSHNYQSDKSNCCCCNHGSLCNFDWRRDVWKPIEKYNIQYHGICTSKDQLIQNFEDSMEKKLGELCGVFQTVGKEQVNDAILQIFIDL
eukprot:TRINITY_DN389_c0_g1_i1.p1 TRINITY_DN389_c0_g1~~TRINITY_DN389_c0_g1_i1.p1  ORF type:complete len:434 (-),score=65.49 TRINITY_DN389_c0_g1_i1:120-1391(-)